MMPPSSSYAASSMPFGAMPGGFDAPPGGMRMRHSVSAIELPQSGGMQGAGTFQQQQSFPMYGLGAPMAPLTDLQHLSSPRASQVLASAALASGIPVLSCGKCCTCRWAPDGTPFWVLSCQCRPYGAKRSFCDGVQAAAQMGSGGMMVRVGSEQHLISDHPQQHMGRTPSDASYPALTGSPSHRPYSPGGGMPRSVPLITFPCC